MVTNRITSPQDLLHFKFFPVHVSVTRTDTGEILFPVLSSPTSSKAPPSNLLFLFLVSIEWTDTLYFLIPGAERPCKSFIYLQVRAIKKYMYVIHRHLFSSAGRAPVCCVGGQILCLLFVTYFTEKPLALGTWNKRTFVDLSPRPDQHSDTERNVLPLYLYLQMVRHSSLLG